MITGESYRVGIKVKNDIVICYVNDQVMVKSYKMPKNLSHGGIGFRAWNQNNGGKIIIRRVSVEKID